MIIKQNISLKPYNTFGIEAKAADFIEINSIEGLNFIIDNFNLAHRKMMILGGGSNILLTKDYDGLVLKMDILGIEKIAEDDNAVFVKAMAGEKWHNFVLYCVSNGYAGVENLSLIPGCVGAAPMQNIGAYGAEIKDVCFEVEAYHTDTNERKVFTNAECKFGYRESIFKHEAKGLYIITSVTFKLNKKANLNISYGAIEEVLKNKNIIQPSIKDVSDAVIEIRQSKLPNPTILGNAGSFFKNPEIQTEKYLQLKEQFTDMVGYKTGDSTTKLAAGWLIEQCGWKGKVVGNTGSHKNQALVLVNYGEATGNEIWNLALAIQKSVLDKFGVTIVPEVNII
ncbi:MAG: UDP-N-acetylmuramate dehydrogenase [Bacteroidota bacterium]